MYPRLYGDMKRIIKIKTCIPILIKGAHPKNKMEIWNGIFHEGGVGVSRWELPNLFCIFAHSSFDEWSSYLTNNLQSRVNIEVFLSSSLQGLQLDYNSFLKASLNLTKESKYTNDRLLEIVISRHSESVPWRRRCPPFGPLGITRVLDVIPLFGDVGDDEDDDEDDVDHIPGVQCQMCIALSCHQLLSSTNSSINIF